MAYSKKIALALLGGALLFQTCRPAQTTTSTQTAPQTNAARVWPEIKKEHRPWTRWWWMGNAVDKENIQYLLTEYAKQGLGGVEIAPIYGAIGHEPKYIQYLSPNWMEMLQFTVQQANNLGMGVDLTQGTGWPFGGPQIKPQSAAAKLLVQNYTLKAGQPLTEKITVKDPKQAEMGPALQVVMAYSDKGEKLDISSKVTKDGQLNWQPKTGTWQVYALFSGYTRQMVKRAAPGGEGLTLNHLSRPALDTYLARFEQAFNGRQPGVRAFYNDSYEVYGANWSPEFLDFFKERRGYDLRHYLPELMSKDKTETVARLKADYRETMSEMVLENFTQPWTNWAHARGSITKNQAHGSPGNLLDLYATVDIPEGETFGSSYFPIPGLRRDSADVRNVDPDPLMLKFASSAAHAAGKNLASCETFTWLGEHFKTSFSQCKPEVEQVFLAGINHVFYHGVTYSPQHVAWPGWLFYASVNFTPANSLWPHFNALNNYITRCQSVLQAGQPDNEILVYWPVYDVWSKPQGMEMLIKVHDIDEWLHPTPFYQQSKKLIQQGYSLDFASDKMLAASQVRSGQIFTSVNAAAHQVLLVPKTQFMPVATFENILKLARAGATVVLEELPADVPGLHEVAGRREKLKQLLQNLAFASTANGMRQSKIGQGEILLTADIPAALAFKNITRESLTDTGLKFIRRRLPDGYYYYLVNHTPNAIDASVPLNISALAVVIMDPQTGQVGTAATTAANGKTSVRVQLAAGEALILKATTTSAALAGNWQYLETAAAPLTITGNWNLHFSQGGPALPTDQKLTQLVSWTALPDKKAEAFSGSGEYTVTFNLPNKKAGEYVLDLGQVNESANVWLNGKEVGTLWSIPYRARVGQYLTPGKNTLKVEVANLMANRIRHLDQQKIEWRKYHEINFVNIDYKPFDASVWKPMPSGLLGPVTLTPYATSAAGN